MAAANAGFEAYKAGQSIAKLKDAASSLQNLNKAADVSVTLTYGQQKNSNTRQTASTTGAASQVSAGGQTNIVATGAGTHSDINIDPRQYRGQSIPRACK